MPEQEAANISDKHQLQCVIIAVTAQALHKDGTGMAEKTHLQTTAKKLVGALQTCCGFTVCCAVVCIQVGLA